MEKKVSWIRVAAHSDFPSISLSVDQQFLYLCHGPSLPGTQMLRYHLDHLQTCWGTEVELFVNVLPSGQHSSSRYKRFPCALITYAYHLKG